MLSPSNVEKDEIPTTNSGLSSLTFKYLMVVKLTKFESPISFPERVLTISGVENQLVLIVLWSGILMFTGCVKETISSVNRCTGGGPEVLFEKKNQI